MVQQSNVVAKMIIKHLNLYVICCCYFSVCVLVVVGIIINFSFNLIVVAVQRLLCFVGHQEKKEKQKTGQKASLQKVLVDDVLALRAKPIKKPQREKNLGNKLERLTPVIVIIIFVVVVMVGCCIFIIN